MKGPEPLHQQSAGGGVYVAEERLYREVRPTDWNIMKTEAIDFSAPFLWLDDALLYTERKTLQDHGKLNNWLVMNKRDPNMAKKALDRIRQYAG